ncbi:hypothetical protein FRC12_025151 [Ceratobasidium sp. 428]|nr:hypothetical protein FRC12_025151 [Ceratobasidium sp. 428]
METALNEWITTQLHLKEAAASFLDACLTLRKVAQSSPLHPSQSPLEDVLDGVQSRTESIAVVENCVHESRSVINALLNTATSRVPINKLSSEILGRIFSVAVASSPCIPMEGYCDTLLNIPLVCARWYQVATSNLSLWSHIDISPSPTNSSSLGLNRVQLLLKRSRGAPIYIHANSEGHETEADVPSLISILQPYRTSTCSLITTGTDVTLMPALLKLYLGDSGPGALNTLAISDYWHSEYALHWPAYPIRELLVLELVDLNGDGGFALEELVAMLSDCPRLHTLRMMQCTISTINPEQQRDQTAIILPGLKILELVLPGQPVVAVLLALIKPGKLEVDVKLCIYPVIEFWFPRHNIRSFLARSNVVSLNLPIRSALGLQSVEHAQNFFSCVPHLRALYIPSTGPDANAILRALSDSNVLRSLPFLQSLCIIGGITPLFMNHIRLLVRARRLYNLVFYFCKFSTSYDEQLSDIEYQGEEVIEAGDTSISDDEGVDCEVMPESTREWLSQRVERLIMCKTPGPRTFNGVNDFISSLK